MTQSASATTIQQTDAQSALADHISKLYKANGKTRYAEEREWATAGYFDQLKQWLEEDPNAANKLRPITKSKSNKWPMPVTNLFSKAISTNGNALGADVPRMRALSGNYDAINRRAADAAENVIDAANRESGMNILNPRLAHMVPLWGIAAVYDKIAFDHSTIEVPEVSDKVPEVSDTQDAGTVAPEGQTPGQDAGAAQPAPSQTEGQTPGSPAMGGELASPEVQASGVQTVPTARLQSYLLTPFEFYLPRDAQDANLAGWKMVRWRRPLGEVKENYPDQASYLTKDDAQNELAAYYLNTLRSLSFQNQSSVEGDQEYCTLTEFWADWTEIPEEVQKKITAEWQNEPSQIYEEQGFTKLQAGIEFGLFAVLWKDQIVQWAENPWDGDSPITFFCWQKDPASVYPKGLSVELIPLTKKLNRIDSLIEREAMSSGTGKWVIPNTQQSSIRGLSGDPQEVIYWDPIGEGKEKPEYHPGVINTMLMKYRQSVVDDIEKLSFTNSVAEGEMPGSGTAFRALAYLGSKAEETRKTQRYLWEQAHEERAKKLVPMCRKIWTEPRKAQVRGYNNQFGMQELDVADLQGEYEIQVIQDSSRPQTLTEKLQAIQMAQAGGLIDPTDAQAKEYTLNLLGLDEMDENQHLQFSKADRDLEKLKQGIQPMESPFTDWKIPLKSIANFSFTEEFEALPDNIRNGILMYGQYTSEKLQVATGAPLGAAPGPPGPLPPPGGPGPSPKEGVGGQSASHVLGQVPGSQVSAQQVQGAAIREAANVVPNSPSPTA